MHFWLEGPFGDFEPNLLATIAELLSLFVTIIINIYIHFSPFNI